MIRSMTGYGRARNVINGREIQAEIKSVNHKFFECSIKTPRGCTFLEPLIKAVLKERITRGKIEFNLFLHNIDVQDTTVTVNKNIAESYISAIISAAPDLGLKGELSVTDIFRIPDVFTVIKEDEDEQALWADVSQVVNEAVDKFIAMRETEGQSLKRDVLEKAANIESMVEKIEAYSPENVANYRKKLYDKMCEILEDKQIDEQRILLEAGIFAEKTAVDEETVRLRSHISQLRSMMDSEKEIGRKTDFLIQEINRETNTIGSKAADLRVTALVVEMKSEIEKIREQIQNIE